MHQRWVYFFGQGQADGGGELKHLVGGKGASLADMTRAQLQVPPGFTLSTECCDFYYRNGRHWPDGLDAEIRANLARLEQLAGRPFGRGDNALLVAVRSGAAQSMPGMMDTVLNVGLSPEVVGAMAVRTGNARGAWEAYYHFLLLFARTVGGLDDAALDAFTRRYLDEVGKAMDDDLDAGQLEVLCGRLRALYRDHTGHDLPTEPWAMLCAAINAVFASWNSERAITYRRHHKIDGLLGTAVNVQMMCASEVSGVLFTANPVNPTLNQTLIESSYGLGEAIVLGKVTPDRFVVEKGNHHILERVISRKEKKVATLAQDGKGQTGAKDAASLTDGQVQELAHLGERVEAYFGHPCDVEWALSQGAFYLLQARPIKFRAQPAGIDPAEREKVRQEEIAALRQMAEPGGTVWSRFSLYEVLPEPTPMTWAVVKRFMSGQGGYGLMYRDLGFDPDPALDEEGVFDLICGRPYCNLSREPRMQYRTLPFEHPFELLKKNPDKAMYPQAVPNVAKAGLKFWLFLPVVFAKQFRSSLKLLKVNRTFAHRFIAEVVPAYLDEVAAAARQDWSGKSDAELLELFHYWCRRTLVDFARDSLKPTMLAAVALGNLERALAKQFQPGGLQQTEDGQVPGLKQAQEALRTVVMGTRAAEGTDLPGAMRALQQGRLTKAEFLEGFGHRGSQEMELSRPRWAEDHADLDRLIEEVPGVLPAPNLAEEADETRARWEQFVADAKLTPQQKTALTPEVMALRQFVGLREAAKHYLLEGYALIRRALVELDRRHRLDGGIFFLTPDELPKLIAVKDEAARQPLLDLIARRRARREIALGLPVPQVLFSDDLEAIGRAVEVSGTDTLRGVPLSVGVAEAAAWVLDAATGARAPDEPYILVCPSTDPAWVPLFIKARGLVMETGGVLSHGAIVAREFGLPAVAGIADVHRRLKTGQRLRIDGATGTVQVLP